MASLNRFRTDTKKELEGVWASYGSGIELLIARLPNPAFERKVRELAAPHLKATRSDTLSEDLDVEITREAVAHTILLDWRGITETDDEGSPAVPYSPEAALEFFKDPELQDFYRFVRSTARNSEQYRKEVMAQAAGN